MPTRTVFAAFSWLLSILLLSVSAAAATRTLYVAPNGNDANPGTAERPLRTLRGARDRVRALAERTREKIVVYFRPGEYAVRKTVFFGPQDSGAPGAPVVYKSAGKPGSAILLGGEPISQWRPEGGGIYSTQLDRNVYALFENGSPAVMARQPNEGYDFFESVTDFRHLTLPKEKWRRFDFRGAAVCLWAHWLPARIRIRSVDFDTGLVTLDRPYGGDLSGTVWDDEWAAKTPTRFYIYNSRSFLDRPGEFYMDPDSHRLYYMPRKEPIVQQRIIAPAVDRIISLDGARHIVFEGIEFAVADGLLDVETTLQLHRNVKGGLIHLRNSTHVTIQDCRLRNGGQNGIVIEGGVTHCTVAGDEITQVASGGVRVVDGDNRHLVIEDNWIHHIGEGIYLLGSSDDRVAHNLIHDAESNGIKLLRCQRELVSSNDVSRIGLDGTDSDGAGIYVNVTAGGPSGGHIRIDQNRVHDIIWNGYPGYPSAAIYLDMDGVYNCTVSRNIIFNLKHKYAIHIRGANHVVRNNVIDLDGPDLLAAFTLVTGYRQAFAAADAPPIHNHNYTIARNIVWTRSGKVFRIRGKIAPDTFRLVDRNVYYSPASKYVFGNMTAAQWRRLGLDHHSLFADPGFVDREAHDYRLRPDSPALKLGFRPIDPGAIGPRRCVWLQQ